MQTKCVQKSPKPAKNGRFCRPAISSSKWGASLLKVTYVFLWLWSSYFSLTAAQYNTHELFNSSLPNQMGIFSPEWTFWLSLYRTIQVIPASGSTPDHGLENIHRVANQFVSLLLKIWQYKWKDSVLVCATALLFVIVLLFVKTHNVCGLIIHGPIGMQRRLCGRDTAQPMKNNTCKN